MAVALIEKVCAASMVQQRVDASQGNATKWRMTMKAIAKPALALGIAAALALASIAPSQARVRPRHAPAIGLAAGAAIASAAAANAYGYGPEFSYGPGYDAYAYSPYGAGAATPYPDTRYEQPYHGYDSNYVGPWRERQLQGLDD
jgi:hypothetical protein